MIDVLILNRNLKKITNQLFKIVIQKAGVDFCGVIDAGSRIEEVSEHTIIRDESEFAITYGVRPSRGFNLGLKWVAENRSNSEWILFLPNDSEIKYWDITSLQRILKNDNHVKVIRLLSTTDPYLGDLEKNGVALGWNFQEGPFIINTKFALELCDRNFKFFDENNFRGYLSFIELAIKTYANNKCILATNNILIDENKSHLIFKSNLINTESIDESIKLYLIEGLSWLKFKYGILDKFSFELIARLLFEEFLRVNPTIGYKVLK